MIRSININGFKCFDDETVELRDLTILTGVNSSGKSSLIQAIMLAVFHQKNPAYLESFGNFNDIKNRYTNPLAIEIIINNNTKVFIDKTDIKYENVNQFNIKYLNASRVGVSSINEYQSYNNYQQFNMFGAYSAGFYEKNKSELILDKLQKKEAYSLTFDGQVNYWLSYISDLDIQFDTQEIGNKAHAYYKIEKVQESIKPENVGTGLNYLLIIIINCLLVKERDIVIIENPEIHLHPLAQKRVGEFLAFVASAGIQVIVETHNDHIINSICYQQYKKTLKEEQVIIQYKKSSSNPFEKIEIKNGQFVNTQGENRFPEGFFDATLQELFEING